MDRKGVILMAVAPLTSDPGPAIDLTVVKVLLDAGAGPDWGPPDGDIQPIRGIGDPTGMRSRADCFPGDPDEPLGLMRLASSRSPLGRTKRFQVTATTHWSDSTAAWRYCVVWAGQMISQGVAHSVARRLFDGSSRRGAESVLAHDILVRILASFSGIWPPSTT